MSRISVIGAGIGGMCAATRLAVAGHHVEVFESSDRVGGKCRTEWFDEYAFDIGPTLLTIPAVFRDFFLKTGAPMEEVLTLNAVNPSFDYRFSDGSRVQFSNLSRFETLLAIEKSFGLKSSQEWSELMKRASDIWDISRSNFIESELSSPLSLLKSPTLFSDLRTIAPWKTLRTLVTSATSDYRLQYIVDRYATYSGSDPRRAPAALLSIAFVEEAFGAWHISGGIGQLSAAIYNRALESGVVFHLNAKVEKILHESGRAQGIKLADGRKVNSEVIVANADASQIYSTLITGAEKVLMSARKSLSKATPSLAGFSLLLGIKEDSPKGYNNDPTHHTVLFPEKYDEEFDSIFVKHFPVEDPAIYICSPKDSKMTSKSKCTTWSVLVNAPKHSQTGDGWNWDDAAFAHRYAERILDLIESRGIEVRNRIEMMKIRTPSDLEREVHAPGGSIYGTSSNGARAAFLRAKNRSPLKGLFCVGGSAHPGGGLPLVAISAEIVANMIGKA